MKLTVDIVNNSDKYKEITNITDYNHFYGHRKLFSKFLDYFDIQLINDFLDKIELSKEIEKDDNKLLYVLIENGGSVQFKYYILTLYKNLPFDVTKRKILYDTLEEIIKFIPKMENYYGSKILESILKEFKDHLNADEYKKIVLDALLKISSLYQKTVFYIQCLNKILFILKEENWFSTKFVYLFEIAEYLNEIPVSSFSVIEVITSFLEYIIEFSQKKDKKRYVAILYNFYIKNEMNIQHNLFQTRVEALLKKYHSIMGEEIETNQLSLALSRANKKALESMETINIPFSEEMISFLNKYEEDLKVKLDAKTNGDKLIKFLFELPIISEEQIQEQVSSMKNESVFLGTIPTIGIDGKTGKVIYNGDSDYETRGLAVGTILEIYIGTYIRAFHGVFWFDESVKDCIKYFLEDNTLCSSGSMEIVQENIEKLLQQDISGATSNLISSFESNLRYFFSSKSISTIDVARSQRNVDLNDMLNKKVKNKFRDELNEYITEDYLNILDYFLVQEIGGNIRNKVQHGEYDKKDFFRLNNWYVCFLIIKMYLGFKFV